MNREEIFNDKNSRDIILKENPKSHGMQISSTIISNKEMYKNAAGSGLLKYHELWKHVEGVGIKSCDYSKTLSEGERYIAITTRDSLELKKYINRVNPRKSNEKEYSLGFKFFYMINPNSVMKEKYENKNNLVMYSNLSKDVKNLITSANAPYPSPTRGKILFDTEGLMKVIDMLKMCDFELTAYEYEEVAIIMKYFRYTVEIKDHIVSKYKHIKDDTLFMWFVIYELLDLSYNYSKLQTFKEYKKIETV